MKYIIEQLNHNSAAIGILVLFVSGLWSLLKFTEYLSDKRFKTYHELIDQLVDETKNPDKVIKLDKQIAVVFELRSFSSYYPVTNRILTDLKEEWSRQPRIVKEIDLTLDFISKNIFVRSYRKIFKR